MNILVCKHLKAGSLGTESVHTYEVLSNLAKVGHNLVLLNADYPRSPTEIEANVRSLSAHIRNSLRWARILKPFGYEITILWLFVREIYIFLSAFIIIVRRKKRISIIYRRHNLFNSEYLLAKLFRIPSVKEVNGIMTDETKIAKQGDRISLRIMDRIERFNMPKADKIIVVASRMKEVLQRDYGVAENKMVVITNGANTDLFKPMDVVKAREELGLNRSDNYICFVGNLQRWQGVEYLIKSIPLILKQCPRTKFLIVGDGPMNQELIELAEQIGVSNRVIFVGMVPYQKVPLYMNASDVCVAPFIRERNERCGVSPLKLCEYMACGKPVVASRVGGLEILEENQRGVLVEPEKPSELATAIIKLLQNQELRKQMGANGRKYVVENQSWESVAKRVADVCEAAIICSQKK